MNKGKINVLLVDDHDLILHGIEHVLEGIPAVGAVRSARSGGEALELIDSVPLDLCILDIELPDLSGFDLIGHIRSRDPRARIIVNTMHEEIWNIHRLMDCGVDAIILKSSNAEELRRAVDAVLGGETYFCRRFRRMSDRLGRAGSELADCSALTQRELDVLRAIAKGYNTGEIAAQLFLSENTIETHRKKLMLKLGARNMAELVVKAIGLGIVTV